MTNKKEQLETGYFGSETPLVDEFEKDLDRFRQTWQSKESKESRLFKQAFEHQHLKLSKELSTLSNEQVDLKNTESTSELEDYEFILFQVKEITKKVDLILGNLEDYIDEGKLTVDGAQVVGTKFITLKPLADKLKTSIANNILREKRKRAYADTRDSNSFRLLLEKSGLTMKHTDAQILVRNISRIPAEIRDLYVKTMTIELEVEEELESKDENNIRLIYSLIDYGRSNIEEIQAIVKDALNSKVPNEKQREIIEEFWSNPKFIERFKLLDERNAEQEIEAKCKISKVILKEYGI